MAVADIPANLIVNVRTSYEQYLWLLPSTGLYRWDADVTYMYLIRAIPVEGQGLPPLPPAPPSPTPFSLAENKYLDQTFVKTVNGIPVDAAGNVVLPIIDAAARATANAAVPASVAGNQQVFFKNPAGGLGGLSVSTGATGGVLVQRQANGHVIVPGTPVATTDAASKQYVDANVATRAGNTRLVATGTGLQGGGDLSADRTLSLTPAVIASLGKADSAVQAPALTTGLAGKADLVNGLIPTSQIPPLAISEPFTVASQAAMLALTAQRGDLAIRTDLPATFVLASDDPTTLSNWKQLATPTDAVLSVAGRIGAIVLGKSDVGLSNVDNTSDANKPLSTAATSALAGKADKSLVFTAGTGLTGGGDLTAGRSFGLTAAAQASLTKADTAYQKPSSGIAYADLEVALQAAYGKAISALQAPDIAAMTSGRLAATAQRIPNGGDLNAYTDSGKYRGLGLTNAPNAYWNFYDVVKHSEGNSDDPYVVQRSVCYAGDAASVGFEYVRIRQSGVWSGWRQVADGNGPIDTTARGRYAKPAGGIPDSDLSSKFVKTVNSNAPDAAGNVVVSASGGGYIKPGTGIPKSDLESAVQTSLGKADTALQSAPVTSVAGRGGAVTLTKADVGLSNVANTADMDKPISTAMQAALAEVKVAAIREALANYPLVTEGHSFMVGSGVESPNKWAEQFAAMFGMKYPTLKTSGDLMRAVGGSAAEEISQRAFGAGSAQYKWRLGDRYALLSENLINTSRRTGAVAAAKTGALHAVRGLVALACSDRAYPATDMSFFTYSSGWTSSSVAASMSQTPQTLGATATAAGNVTFVMPSPGKAWVLILSRNASMSGNLVRVYNMTKGVTEITTFDNTNTAAADTVGTYITIPIEIHAEPGDTIRIDAPGATRLGNFTFDGLLVAGRSPAPVFLMKEPYLADYSLSTAYPKGSDAVFDYFNDVHDQVAAEFGNVVVANPNTAGYWDKTTMIQSDGVHPNVSGSTALAQTMRDAALAQLPKILARGALGLT